MFNESIQHGNVTVVNVYAPNARATGYLKQC